MDLMVIIPLEVDRIGIFIGVGPSTKGAMIWSPGLVIWLPIVGQRCFGAGTHQQLPGHLSWGRVSANTRIKRC